MKKGLVLAAVLGLLSPLAPVPGAGQEVVIAPRGWIGVSLEATTTVTDGVARTLTRVVDVMAGSPAEEAGILPGDLLLAINGRSWQEELESVTRGLRPGDPVTLVVERDGRRREFRLRAGARPVESLVLPSWSFTVNADSMAEYLYKAMDSLRIRITRGGGQEIRLATEGRLLADSVVWTVEPGGEMRVRLRQTEQPTQWVTVAPFAPAPSEGVVPEVRPPFGFFIFRGEKHDSLNAEMERLNQELRALRSQQAVRVRELARTVRGEETRIDRNDPQLVRLDARLEELSTRADALRRAMEEAARVEAMEGRRLAVPMVPGAEVPEEVEVGLRPLAPYVLGQNRAAGAEVVDLRPELAAYFQVEGGVLVVDVPPGTLAEAAGIQPGDVLVRVGGDAIRSIADLRRGLARATPQLPITLVRKGRTMDVLLRR